MNLPLAILGAALAAVQAHGRLLRPLQAGSIIRGESLTQSKTSDGAHLKLFCFAFTPRRPGDEDKLPEVRLQLSWCDGHMFYTDTEAPGGAARDITYVEVPKQEVDRSSSYWLMHRNMAALTQVWKHMLQAGTVDGFDWVINVELDHFTRPSKVRSAIAHILMQLGHGSPWERSFVENLREVSTKTLKPMMLAFGNAYLFSKESVAVMKRQWHLVEPNMTAENGCPLWSSMHCEQDIVYPKMLPQFTPPIQMFGSNACGRNTKTADGTPLPLTCWDFFMNPYRPYKKAMTLSQEVQAIVDISEGKGKEPKLQLAQGPAVRITADMSNVSDALAALYWPRAQELLARAPHMKWDRFLPPKNIPLIHHMYNSTAHERARLVLGL